MLKRINAIRCISAIVCIENLTRQNFVLKVVPSDRVTIVNLKTIGKGLGAREKRTCLILLIQMSSIYFLITFNTLAFKYSAVSVVPQYNINYDSSYCCTVLPFHCITLYVHPLPFNKLYPCSELCVA